MLTFYLEHGVRPFSPYRKTQRLKYFENLIGGNLRYET